MNLQEYIKSGLLEAFVIGALSVTEAEEVAYNVSINPELAAEVFAIEQTLLLIAQRQSVPLPLEMQNIIWEKIVLNRSPE